MVKMGILVFYSRYCDVYSQGEIVVAVDLARDEFQNQEITRTVERYEKYINPSHIKMNKMLGFETTAHSARGAYILDARNELFLDCLSGFGACSLGHSNPEIIREVKNQLDKMALSSKVMLDSSTGILAEKLARLTPGDLQYSIFCNSGSEAVDTALKIACLAQKKAGIISTINSNHGKTLGALSVTGREYYRKDSEPLLPYVTFVPYGQLEAIQAVINANTAAIIVEPIQVEGGVILPPYGYLNGLRKICDINDILLIIDEVQTGLGCTGYMFACELEDVTPDILVLAKSLGGGVLPIGSITARPGVWEVLIREPFLHKSTFGGNPLSTTAAAAAINILTESGIILEVRDKGDYLLRHLQTFLRIYPTVVKEVRGRGLLIGIELVHEGAGNVVISQMFEQNILTAFALNNTSVIKLQPPFIITYQELDYVIAALEKAIKYAEEMLYN